MRSNGQPSVPPHGPGLRGTSPIHPREAVDKVPQNGAALRSFTTSKVTRGRRLNWNIQVISEEPQNSFILHVVKNQQKKKTTVMNEDQ